MQPTESSTPLLLKGLRWFDEQHPAVVLTLGLCLIGCIGYLGYVTGPLLSTSLLYLIPLLLITRSAGLFAGIFSALLAASLWLSTDLSASLNFAHPVTPYWNVMMRLGTFLVAIGLVAATKSLNAHLEERVLERTAALEVQIAETRELEKAILEISDRERATVGQDLHDGLCQHLVGAAFTANLLREKLATSPESCTKDADRIADMIDESITQARNLARGLHPVRMEAEGLEMAVNELALSMELRFGIRVEVRCPSPLPCLQDSVGIHLYRIVQEAVTNAAKHAKASQVTISLLIRDQKMIIEIEDNGIGIHHSTRSPIGMGLSIMEYRARMIGADFEIIGSNPSGTTVRCDFGILSIEC